jgi:hypothetical protein
MMVLGYLTRLALAMALLGASVAPAAGQTSEGKQWTLVWSQSMAIGFLSYGAPDDEPIHLPQSITERLASSVAVTFDVGHLTVSIASLTLRDGETLSAKEALDLRLAAPAKNAEDYQVVKEVSRPNSDFPYVEREVSYTLPSGDPEARRVMVVTNGPKVWIIDARGLFEQPAREAANRVFDSLQMDPQGRVRPGGAKRAEG